MKKGKIDQFKLALLISCAVHFSLLILFPGSRFPFKSPPKYLEVHLIKVAPKRISGGTPQIKTAKKAPEVKKISISKLPPLKVSPLPGPKLPILTPPAEAKDEMRASFPTPEFVVPLKRDIESSPYPPRFFWEKGTIGIEHGVPEEAYLPPRAALPSAEGDFAYERKEPEVQQRGARVRIKGPLGMRKIFRRIEPVYPEWAERQGIEGSVELRPWVLPSGEVRPDVEILRSSGWLELDECARQALMQWKFEPIKGKEIQGGESSVEFIFTFKQNQEGKK